MFWSRTQLLQLASVFALGACAAPAPPNTPERPNTPTVENPGDPGGNLQPSTPTTPSTTCVAQTVDATRYLRQLSLDLRGRPPSVDEIARVESLGSVPDALIDAMLDSAEFLQRARDWHKELLWPTLDGYRISTTDLVGFDANATGGVGPTYSPDPELSTADGQARHPAGAVAIRYNGTGDRVLRGGNGTTLCDARRAAPFEYPEPAPRGQAQPTYTITTSDGASVRRPYYDNDGVAMPIYDGDHCPNYCTDISPNPGVNDVRVRLIRPGICQVVGTGALGITSNDYAKMLPATTTVANARMPAAWTAAVPAITAGHCVNPGDPCVAGDIFRCADPGGSFTVAGANATVVAPNGWTTAALDPLAPAVANVRAPMFCPPWAPFRTVNACDNQPYNGPDDTFRIRREGTRRVSNWYWANGQELRVCALDASPRTNSAYNNQSCSTTYMGRRDTSCGCGPEGAYCMPSVSVSANTDLESQTQARLREALNSEPLEIVASVIQRNEDYYQIFSTPRSFVNGPMRFMYERQLASVQGIEMSAPAPMDTMPNVPFNDSEYREYVRGAEHAGVLTTAAYLGRFPTWRSRVAQIRTAFMCKSFTPGTDRVPAPTDPCTREPNLAARCGCQNCHAAIEPLTAYFARWAERSTRYLNPIDFPVFDANCAQCALRGIGCTARCRTQYVTDTVDADGARFAGTLRGYLYRRPDEMPRADQGPSGIIAAGLASGEVQSCTVRTAWKNLVNRSMSENEVRTLLPGIVNDFAAHNHNYRSLVRAIVTSATYRRID